MRTRHSGEACERGSCILRPYQRHGVRLGRKVNESKTVTGSVKYGAFARSLMIIVQDSQALMGPSLLSIGTLRPMSYDKFASSIESAGMMVMIDASSIVHGRR